MSPSDIGRIQPVVQGRSVSRDLPENPAKPPEKAATSQPGDIAVKVETSGSIDPGRPPVDRSRVEVIRKALEQGTYPILPTKIADAMIAAPMLLSVKR